MTRPLAIDMFCGLGGWAEGLLIEGFDVIGFDIEQHQYGEHKYPAQLVIQDVLTLHGSQFRDAALIVASPPCQEFSYMAMPWSRAKAKAAAIRADATGQLRADLTRLFDACFRIQREACEAAGRHVPMVVENVRGAIPWVGRSRWNFGSFHLWGDVPALMPVKYQSSAAERMWRDRDAPRLNDATKNNGGSWFNIGSPGQKVVGQNPDGRLLHVRDGHAHTRHLTNPAEHGIKHGGDCFNDPAWPGKQGGTKQPGISGPRDNGKGDAWFQDGAARHGSKSNARKAASAMIAKIPLPLSRHIAATFRPMARAA